MATLSPVRTELTLDRLLQSRTVLMLPGWNGSGSDHWQTIWEHKHSSIRRVEQRSWAEPSVEDWVSRISAYVSSAEQPVLLIAHSLACVAVAHWANREPFLARRVESALMVAPADVDEPSCSPEALRGFSPIPQSRFPFGSITVGSENDPYMSLHRARELASAWGGDFVNAGRVGHINCASGHGSWPDGELILARLLEISS